MTTMRKNSMRAMRDNFAYDIDVAVRPEYQTYDLMHSGVYWWPLRASRGDMRQSRL